MLIAIDGPAASGKGTIGKMIAEKYGLEYLDTGKLYRAVGYLTLKSIGDVEDFENFGMDEMRDLAVQQIPKITEEILNSRRLNNEGMGKIASVVSSLEEVRAGLLDYQRDIAKSESGAVLDGRDIGTVVCPEADLKFYITASPEIRAKRRYKQLQTVDKSVNESSVLKNILERDKRDSERKAAPMTQSEDANYIDTSEMSIEDVFENIVSIIDASA